MLFYLIAASAQNAPMAYAETPGIPWIRITLAFAFCIFLAIAAIGFIRIRNGLTFVPDEWRARLQGNGKEERPLNREWINVVQRVNLMPGSQLVVVQCGQLHYLLHITGSAVTVIDRFEDTPGRIEAGRDAP